MSNMDAINKYIDHTLLKPEARESDIRRICAEAIENSFFGVCVNSSWTPLVSSLLNNSSVQTVSVIGFPLGAMSSECKSFEAGWATEQGAKEIDMVIHLGFLKDRKYKEVTRDIKLVVESAKSAQVKVILETGLLNKEEIEIACKITVDAGAHFVKTCTGFNAGIAEIDHIILMRKTVGPHFGVKASGGIKSLEQALALISAGANRLGTSAGLSLIQGKPSSINAY